MKSNIEIARAYAAGATKGHAANLFIENDTIYSYGYHFPVAKKLKEGIYLFNIERYSNSTSRHQSDIADALSHAGAKLIRVFAMDKNGNDGAAFCKLNYLKKKVARARKPELYESDFVSICSAAQNLDKVLKRETNKDFKVKFATFVNRAKKEKGRDILDFYAGKKSIIDTPTQLIRFDNGDRIITSKGVKLRITEELKRQARALLANDFKINEKIGDYYIVHSLKNTQVKIGCHTFNKAYLTEKINELLAM